MYITLITGEQLIREISKRQVVREIGSDFPVPQNRRSSPRLRTMDQAVPCRVTTLQGARHRSAFANFSDTGALLEGPLPLLLEQSIEIFISFMDSGETFVLRAKVVRFQNDHVGVQFE